MDLNLYLGLPPLPRPPGRLGAAMDCPAPADSPVPEAPGPVDESPAPEEMPPLPAVFSPSDALSTPEMPPIDPMLVEWLDGLGSDSEDTIDNGEPAMAFDAPALGSDSEDTLDAGELARAHDAASHSASLRGLVVPMPEAIRELYSELYGMPYSYSPSTDSAEALGGPAVVLGAPSHDDDNASPQPLPLAGLEGVHLEWVERLSHPDRAAPATGAAEMVSTRQSVGGVIEDTAPELRFQRLIQVSEQHRAARQGPVSRSQRATSPEAERLALAIQRSHSSLDASRRQNLDSDGKMAGTSAVKKNGNCGCSSSFECNICLDAAKEPVVTPCGHLFCWPCLYQWLHGHSVHSECPVCKGEVLEVNVTPIYGRGGGERDASSNDVPPRPSANRSESMRQQLWMPDSRGIVSMVRRLIENEEGQAAPPVGGAEVPVFPGSGTRVTSTVHRRLQRPHLAPSPLTRHVRRAAPDFFNMVRVRSPNSDNENQDQLRGQAAPPVGDVEVAVLPEDGTRVTRIGRQRQQRPIVASSSPLTRPVRSAAPHVFNMVRLRSSNSDNENQDQVRGQAAPPVGGVEVSVLPEDRTRVTRIGRRRQQRPIIASPSPLVRPVRSAASDVFNMVRLRSPNSDNENQDHFRGQATPPVGGVEVAVLPDDGTSVARIGRRRQQRPTLASSPPLTRLVRHAAPDVFNLVELRSYNPDDVTPVYPQQVSSVEQTSTSSTMAVIVGQAAQSRRSRPPSEPTTTRRTRRRQQH